MKQKLITRLMQMLQLTEEVATEIYEVFMADKDTKEYFARTDFSIALNQLVITASNYL